MFSSAHFSITVIVLLTVSSTPVIGRVTSKVRLNLPKCLLKFDLDVCFANHEHKRPDTPKPACTADVCRKSYRIATVKLKPYTIDIVIDSLRTCCGTCLNYTMAPTLETIANIPSPSNATTHFIFPVLGHSRAKRMYGYHFIPLIEPPSIYYITKRGEDVMLHLIMECLNMWPLMVNCVFMVVISGFLGWLMETWANKDQFPRSFISGWFEGIWWSFISMTTVGYGDKSPKSIPARIFAVLWIMVGITTFSLITAMLSSELTKANNVPPPTISGAKVGALPHRLYDAMVIAKHGGILVNVKSRNDTIKGIYELVELMKQDRINGFAMDRFVMLMLYRYLEGKDPEFVKYLKTKTIQTELLYKGDALSYGTLVKDRDDYEYLNGFIRDNKNVLNTCNSLFINNLSNEADDNSCPESLFLVSGGVFWPVFSSLITTIGIICCFGVFYEMCWRKKGGMVQGLFVRPEDLIKEKGLIASDTCRDT